MHSPFHPLQIFLASVWACYRLCIENKLFLLYKSKMLCLCLFMVFCWFFFVPSFPSKWGLLTSLWMICVWTEYLALNIDVSSRPCLALQAVLQLSCCCVDSNLFFFIQRYCWWGMLPVGHWPVCRHPQHCVPPCCCSHPVHDCSVLSKSSTLPLLTNTFFLDSVSSLALWILLPCCHACSPSSLVLAAY